MNEEKAATHLKLLMEVIAVSTGPVLELGIGAGSTPALHQVCTKQNRRLVSYDNDPKYFTEYADRYRSPLHEFHLVTNWDDADIEHFWSVVLVDHRPAARRRHEVARLANRAEYIVCHDTEPGIDRFYRYSRIYKLFKSRLDDAGVPRTTVLSNFHSMDEMMEE